MTLKKLGKRFNKNDIGVIAENKEKYISFNVKVKVTLAGASNEDSAEECKNIQLGFIDSCRVMASGLDKLARNLCGTSEVQCDKCRDDVELIKVSDEYTALFGCQRCRTKKSKDLDKGMFNFFGGRM